MKKLLLLFLLHFSISYVIAQPYSDIYNKLTEHEWLVYSERIEQYSDDEYIAKETFFDNETIYVVLFDTNGEFNGMHIQEDRTSQWLVNWKLEDDNIILEDENSITATMEIIEINDTKLVVRKFEDRGDIQIAKVTTYCNPDCRLSPEEARLKNERDIFEIDGFTEKK